MTRLKFTAEGALCSCCNKRRFFAVEPDGGSLLPVKINTALCKSSSLTISYERVENLPGCMRNIAQSITNVALEASRMSLRFLDDILSISRLVTGDRCEGGCRSLQNCMIRSGHSQPLCSSSRHNKHHHNNVTVILKTSAWSQSPHCATLFNTMRSYLFCVNTCYQ